jgi:hypothetical protein
MAIINIPVPTSPGMLLFFGMVVIMVIYYVIKFVLSLGTGG